MEISYIRAIVELQERAEQALNVLQTRQSEEMEKASTRITDPTKISMIVAKHVEDVSVYSTSIIFLLSVKILSYNLYHYF